MKFNLDRDFITEGISTVDIICTRFNYQVSSIVVKPLCLKVRLVSGEDKLYFCFFPNGDIIYKGTTYNLKEFIDFVNSPEYQVKYI